MSILYFTPYDYVRQANFRSKLVCSKYSYFGAIRVAIDLMCHILMYTICDGGSDVLQIMTTPSQTRH